jgi:hypothetical protein
MTIGKVTISKMTHSKMPLSKMTHYGECYYAERENDDCHYKSVILLSGILLCVIRPLLLSLMLVN